MYAKCYFSKLLKRLSLAAFKKGKIKCRQTFCESNLKLNCATRVRVSVQYSLGPHFEALGFI